MKRLFLLLVALVVSYLSFSQSVENIHVERDGENILIHYRIGDSTEDQLYNVVLSCEMDGARRFQPKAVIGAVGENIRGGKDNNTITWDVFEDVDEVVDPEFFVKVELVSDMSPSAVQPRVKPERQQKTETSPVDQGFDSGGPPEETFDRRAFVAYTGSRYSPYGISFGTVKNWGFYGSFRFGGWVDYDVESDVWFTAVAGLTKYVLTRGKYRLHGYAGVGTTYEAYEEYTYDTSWTDSYFTIDAGIVNVIGRFNLTLGLEYQIEIGADIVFGVGVVF